MITPVYSANSMIGLQNKSQALSPQSAPASENLDLKKEIEKDLNWKNITEFILKLICAYAGLQFIPRLQKKVFEKNINLQHIQSGVSQASGLDIGGQPFALILGWAIAEGSLNVLKNLAILPKNEEKAQNLNFLDVLIKLGSALACLDLFSKQKNNHIARFAGLGVGFILGELLTKVQNWLEKFIQNKLYQFFPQLKPPDAQDNSLSFGKILSEALSLKVLFWLKGCLIALPLKKVYHFTHMFGQARKLSNDSLINFTRNFTDIFRLSLGPEFALPAFDHSALPLKNIDLMANWFDSRRKVIDQKKMPQAAKFLLKRLFWAKTMVMKYIIGSPSWLKELEKNNKSGFAITKALAKDYFVALGAKSLLVVLTFPIFFGCIYAGHLLENLFKPFFPSKTSDLENIKLPTNLFKVS